MSTRYASAAEDFFGLGLGAFVGSAMAANTPQRRVASAAFIGDRLRRFGVTLVNAELGRTSSGPTWVLTVESPQQQIVTVKAPLTAEQDPHSPETAENVASRVTQYLAGRTG